MFTALHYINMYIIIFLGAWPIHATSLDLIDHLDYNYVHTQYLQSLIFQFLMNSLSLPPSFNKKLHFTFFGSCMALLQILLHLWVLKLHYLTWWASDQVTLALTLAVNTYILL